MTIRPSRENVQIMLPPARNCYAPMYKAVIDLYGNLWACCMRAHPFLQNKDFYLGKVRNGDDFQKIMDSRYNPLLRSKDIPLKCHCSECTEYEYVANICIQKLIEDLDLGIGVNEQPFLLR